MSKQKNFVEENLRRIEANLVQQQEQRAALVAQMATLQTELDASNALIAHLQREVENNRTQAASVQQTSAAAPASAVASAPSAPAPQDADLSYEAARIAHESRGAI